MSRQDDLQKLMVEHNRRLQKLKEKKAKQGSSADPNLDIEIEDIEDEVEKLQVEFKTLQTAPGDDYPYTQMVSSLPYIKSSSRERTPQIFLCHANEDKLQVQELYHKLKAAGYHPWLDKYDLLPGQKWRQEIKKLISHPYNLVVVCLSKNSTTKRGMVQREINWALGVLDEIPEDMIYLIPARLEPCQVPGRLSHLQWVDLFDRLNGFDNLKRALDFEIDKRPDEMPYVPSISKEKEVAFLTYHDRYVTAMGDEAARVWDRWVLRAKTKTLSDREKFTLRCLDDDLIVFKTFHRRYVTAFNDEDPRDWVLRAETRTLSDWEKFIPVNAETKKELSCGEVLRLLEQGNIENIAFKTHHDRYVTAFNDEGEQDWKLKAKTKTLSDWEKFTLIPLS